MEIWKTAIVNGVENPRYQVSTLGRVKCLNWNKTGKEKIINLCNRSKNSDYLSACIDGKRINVHRIVAETFLPKPDPERNCIDHINTIRSENVVLLDDDGQILYTNLRWTTHKENNNNPLTRKHLSENNGKSMLGKLGAEHNRSKSIVQLTKDGLFIKKWHCLRDVERKLGIEHSNISSCCKGRLKTAGGFKWVYADKYVPRTKSISDIKPLF